MPTKTTDRDNVVDLTGRFQERADASTARYFHLRDVNWKESGNGKDYTFDGVAITYGAWSLPLWTPKGEFIERVLPGALADVLAGKPDVRMLKNHNKDLILARTKSGTLEFEDTKEQLRVWARIAKTTYATDLKLAMDRGDIDQMSFQFEFMYDEGAQDRWYEDKATGIIRRDVIKVSGLRDVSIVTFPAYTETAAAMRSIDAAIEHGAFEQIPQEVPVVEDRSRLVREVERFNEAEELLAGGVSRSEQRKLYSRCRQVIAETPWLMLPGYAKVITAIIDERMSGYRPTQEEIQERIGVSRDNEPGSVGQVVTIPVVGPIFNRAGAMQQISGAKSLLDFQTQFRAALADPDVSGIVLDIDSPGGTVDLVPETAAEIRAASKIKPVYGVANAMAASAAYWLLAACEFSAVTPSGDVGSVGVYMMHQDASEMMKQKGIDTTIIKAGAHKAEGNPFEPLSDETKAYMQDGVDKIYDMFVGAIADYRGQTKADVVANFGEGRTVMADDALKFGMVDAIMTLDQVVGKLQQRTIESRSADETADFAAEYAMYNIVGDVDAPGKNVAAIPYTKTDVVDTPWDGPGAKKKVKNEKGPLRALHAWVDSAADQNLKGSYKFPHHEVGDDGTPGAANVNGVRNALSRLSGSNIPDADKPAVERHLQRHLDDFKQSDGDQSTGDSPGNASAHIESREHVSRVLGLGVAQDDPAGETPVAPVTVGGNLSLAEFKAQSRSAAQVGREGYLHLLERIVN